jgi:oligopeptide transport system substrate-binding protein
MRKVELRKRGYFGRSGVAVALLVVLGLLLTACGDATPTSPISTAPASLSTAVPTTASATIAPSQTAGPAVATTVATTSVTSLATTPATVVTTAAVTTAAAGKSPRPGLLREASGNADPPTLDPAGLGATRQILLNLFGGLTTYNENGEIIGLGAEKWTVSDDGKIYTFTLRSDLKFQNGNPVKAGDVVWSFQRNLDPKRKAAAAFDLTDIDGAQDYLDGKASEIKGLAAKDDRTIEFTLNKVAPYFVAKLALPIAAILDKSEVEKNERWWEKHSASIGPFSLKEWKKGQSIRLAANPNYPLGKPKVDVEFLFVADAQTRQALYESGETDIQTSVPDTELDRIRKDASLSKQLIEPKVLTYRTYSLVLNPMAYAPFADVRVRQAVAMAIDRKTLVDKIFTTCAVPQGIIPAGTIPGYNPGVKVLEFNPEKAKELLAEAGFANGQNMPELVITQAGQGASDAYMQYFESQLRTNLGMKVRLDVLERGKYLTELRKKTSLHAFFEGVSGNYLDPQTMLSLPLYSKSSANLYGYESQEFDRLIVAADSEKNTSKRFELYGQAEQQALNDAIWQPMCQGYSKWLVKPYVTGYRLNALGILPYDKIAVS